jgi:hypothetical protein
VEAAKVLATDLVENHGDADERIRALYQRGLTRDPVDQEMDVLKELVTQHEHFFTANPDAAKSLLEVGQARLDDANRLAEIAAWTSVCRTVLNIHEFVTRN